MLLRHVQEIFRLGGRWESFSARLGLVLGDQVQILEHLGTNIQASCAAVEDSVDRRKESCWLCENMTCGKDE